MVHEKIRTWIIFGIAFVFLAGPVRAVLAMGQNAEVPRMTKEELKSMLGSPDLIILDVRADAEWKASREKIQGALREDPTKAVKSWAEKYPKDKTLAFYCS